jgi:hypothetical protein
MPTIYYEQTHLGMAPTPHGSYVTREDYQRLQHLVLCLVGQPHLDPDQLIPQLLAEKS